MFNINLFVNKIFFKGDDKILGEYRIYLIEFRW